MKIERAPGMEEPGETLVKSVTTRSDKSAKVKGSSVRVTLVEPSEPMAWAIGTMSDGVFKCEWNAERVLGGKATAAERDAIVDRRVASFVRVWGDDGSVSTAPIAEARA